MNDFESLKKWKSKKTDVVVLYPGGFKPLTGGHLSLIRRYAELPNVAKVKLLVGPKSRNGIDQNTAIKIANIFLSGDPKIEVEASKYPSPVLTAYKAVETADPGSYTLASSSKGTDWERTKSFIEQHQPGGKYNEKLGDGVEIESLPIDVTPAIYSGRTDENNGLPISASVLRNDIMNDDKDNFMANYPNEDSKDINYVWGLLHGTLTESMENYSSVYPYQHYRSMHLIAPLTEEDEDMEKLEESMVTPKVNKHMTHAEDLIMLGGSDGINWVLKMFTDLYEHLKGFTPEDEITLSVKIDGAPAIFAWSDFDGLTDPNNSNKPGIATKGLFAKNPKLMYIDEDIDGYYHDKPELVYKLKSFLKHIKSLEIPKDQIWQGDFLFDDKSLQETEIDDDAYYAFHPNTIYYVVPKEGDLGKDIANADVGIVWHTRYLGDNLESVTANYNADVSELKSNPKVFMTDPYVKSLAGRINFTDEESSNIEEMLKDISEYSEIFNTHSSNYNEIIKNKDIISLFSIFWNSLIKSQSLISEPAGYLAEFINFIQNRFIKEEDKRKSKRGKSNIKEKAHEIFKIIENNKEMLEMMIIAILRISDLKHLFLEKLNNIGKFQTFLKMKEGGTKKTGQEGFAVSDIQGNVVKLVDRKEFSWSNFSPDVLKGWS